MNQINYKENYEKRPFSDLIQSFGRLQEDNEVALEENIGSGTIRFIDIEPGLQLRIWDCTFKNGLEIFRQPEEDRLRRSFTIAYYLTPDSFVLEDCSHSSAVISEVWNTVLLSSDATFKIQILPNKPLRCVSLNFTAGWLQKNVISDIALHTNVLRAFTYDADPFVLFESLSTVERRVNDSFFDTDKILVGKFCWKSRVLNLVTAFFLKLSGRDSMNHDANYSHEQQIAVVEKQLVNSIYKGLPDIKTMAKNASVSASSLKRYFRKIYGKNIYNYYQEKRMICAKQLLVERKMTVAQTACIMGYGSVSSFNNTFKRFFGLKPDIFAKTDRVRLVI